MAQIPQSRQRGFTLLELILALSLAGLLTWLIVPGYTGLKNAANDEEAIARACMLQTAKTSWMRDVGQSAFETWSIAVSDADKYAVLKPYLGISRDYPTLSDFTPFGYTYGLNGLDSKVSVIRGSDSASLTY